ncbi:hypothetical protein BASA82_000864 [Batrachochytrium salamandrivorans]|nr:hypothetical protein BASA82_000864 [Batrachochytrium salamandrivorans]
MHHKTKDEDAARISVTIPGDSSDGSAAYEAALDADGETGGVHLERALKKRFKLFGSLWEFYFPLVDDISQRNSGQRRCNACSNTDSEDPDRQDSTTKRAAAEFTTPDKTVAAAAAAAPKLMCKL